MAMVPAKTVAQRSGPDLQCLVFNAWCSVPDLEDVVCLP